MVQSALARHPKRFSLQAIADLLAEEHVCVPPDDATPWRPIVQGNDILPSVSIYICPECDQRLVRVEPSKVDESGQLLPANSTQARSPFRSSARSYSTLLSERG